MINRIRAGLHVSNLYPGTEAETIPLRAGADIQPLTCPDGEKYYKWQGKTTSAQYYVNPKGYSTEKACQWGDGKLPIGNWAPINLGVGQNNGKWLSVFQNSPTTNKKLDFNVKIKGDNLSGSCRYEDGTFYSETTSNDSGCTVSLTPFAFRTPAYLFSFRLRFSLAMPTSSSTKGVSMSNLVWHQSR